MDYFLGFMMGIASLLSGMAVIVAGQALIGIRALEQKHSDLCARLLKDEARSLMSRNPTPSTNDKISAAPRSVM